MKDDLLHLGLWFAALAYAGYVFWIIWGPM